MTLWIRGASLTSTDLGKNTVTWKGIAKIVLYQIYFQVFGILTTYENQKHHIKSIVVTEGAVINCIEWCHWSLHQ